MNDEIANLIGYWDWENKTANQCADAILSLPTLKAMMEDAEKWRKVKEIAALRYARTCDGCPLLTCDGALCIPAKSLVDALSEVPDET